MDERNNKLIDLLALKSIPHDRHNDLVLINEDLFDKRGESMDISEQTIDELCVRLKCKRLALKSRVVNDTYRTPKVTLLRGDHSWVTHVDNGIQYTFDITLSMFSTGNIREKIRVSKLNCENEIIVDMFAGIGYFTLPLLVHCNAKLVHACECNPNAIIALNKNLKLNNVSDKCVVHFGDNRLVCPTNIADRVYLGLIPTSLESLEAACRALNINSDRMVLHIHENVSHFGCKDKQQISLIEKNWANNVALKVASLMSSIHNINFLAYVLQVNKVKRYAPRINHLVVDIKCEQKIG